MKLSLNGITIEGTDEKIKEFMDNHPEYKMYWSETKKKYIQLSEMEDHHLKNALIKHAQEYIANLRSMGLVEFWYHFPEGFYDDKTIDLLFDEAVNRWSISEDECDYKVKFDEDEINNLIKNSFSDYKNDKVSSDGKFILRPSKK